MLNEWLLTDKIEQVKELTFVKQLIRVLSNWHASFHLIFPWPCEVIKQEKEIKDIEIGKEEVK